MMALPARLQHLDELLDLLVGAVLRELEEATELQSETTALAEGVADVVGDSPTPETRKPAAVASVRVSSGGSYEQQDESDSTTS